MNDDRHDVHQQTRQDRWLVVSFHVVALVVAFVSGYGVAYVLLWLLPLVTILQPILQFRTICEHGAVTNFASPLTAACTNFAPAGLS